MYLRVAQQRGVPAASDHFGRRTDPSQFSAKFPWRRTGLQLAKLARDPFGRIQNFWQSYGFAEIEVAQWTALALHWVKYELALVETMLRAKICVEIGKGGIEEMKRCYLG